MINFILFADIPYLLKPLACENTKRLYICNGKSCATSSCRIPQDGNIARVCGCSGATQVACHFLISDSANQRRSSGRKIFLFLGVPVASRPAIAAAWPPSGWHHSLFTNLKGFSFKSKYRYASNLLRFVKELRQWRHPSRKVPAARLATYHTYAPEDA